MAYKALYRKYRPNTFEEVVGQKSVVATLLNAVKTNKLAHAYLFCGPRGTGKTTVAKLLAKTINCTGEGEKPCGCCKNCLEIQESTYPDVIELDAATNNGVDEVREIIEKVKYAPMSGKYKVYIIDEVHMMTSSAFNALLKTLEEPPEYCIFILATTEPHKVLPTIISRCQRFDFKKIDNRVIAGRLREICDKEEVKCDDEALNLIAELAEGGMRDALSILDQSIAYAQNDITAQKVSEVYGVASLSEKLELFSFVKNQDTRKLVDKINEISARGLDIQRLTIDLVNIAKECVVYNYCQDETTLSILTSQQARRMAQDFSSDQLLKYIEYLIETQSRYRDATNGLTYFEVCLLRMMNYQPVISSRAQPLKEEKPQKPEEKQPAVAEEKPAEEEKKPETAREYVEYSDEKLYEILIRANKAIKEETKNNIAAALFADLSFDDNRLVQLVKDADIMASSPQNVILVVNDRITANQLNEKNNKARAEELFGEHIGKKDLYAITKDQQAYMINYFKAHKDLPKPEVKEEVKPEEKTDNEDKLVSLFGKDGYDVVEE